MVLLQKISELACKFMGNEQQLSRTVKNLSISAFTVTYLKIDTDYSGKVTD